MALSFIIVFSSLAIAVLTMSSTNVQVATNHHTINLARASAESGCEYVNYWMNGVQIPRGTPSGSWFSVLSTQILQNLTDSGITANITSGTDFVQMGDADHQIVLNAETNQSFWARIERSAVDPDVMNVNIYGAAEGLQRNIATQFSFGVNETSAFDFGVASRGPLQLSGNVDLTGFNVSVEADVYIESANTTESLAIIGNSHIAGDVSIANPDGTVLLQGNAGIGGDKGRSAIEDHVHTGVPAPEFPMPNPQKFEQYVQNEIDSSSNTKDTVLENIRIAPGTNPTFNGNTEIRGVVYIEQPNVVTFSGNLTITGLIAGDGDWEDNSGTNQIIFLGNVDSHSVEDLPIDVQFDGLREEKNTFLMAPGFSLAFGGNFSTLNGAIAGNGVTFFGNAGGTIGGSVINYSDTPMVMSGNSDLVFNRSGITEVPAGFEPEIFIHYNPEYYAEVVPAGDCGEASPVS